MQGGGMSTIIMLVLMVVAFYFLLIRPQKKRQQEAAKMQNSLAPGTRVMTTTGLFATVVAIDNEDVILEIAPGVESRWVKAAIGRVVTPVDTDLKGGAAAAHDTADDSTDDIDDTREADAPRDSDQDQSTPKS